LVHGTAGQATLIQQYDNMLKNFLHMPMAHPVIIICDNDDGIVSLSKKVRSKFDKIVSKTTTDSFYHLCLNLYMVKVPEGDPPAATDIESLFDPELLTKVLDGKTFNPKKDHEDQTEYGKVVFAKAVIKANAETVDFSGFEDLLTRVEDVIRHYAKHSAVPSSSTVTP
ncbi:hypothetical protein, partial [Acidithiobacillus caldus]